MTSKFRANEGSGRRPYIYDVTTTGYVQRMQSANTRRGKRKSHVKSLVLQLDLAHFFVHKRGIHYQDEATFFGVVREGSRFFTTLRNIYAFNRNHREGQCNLPFVVVIEGEKKGWLRMGPKGMEEIRGRRERKCV